MDMAASHLKYSGIEVDREVALIEATLALAYEQKTANLIAMERLQIAIIDSECATTTLMPATLWERL